MKISPPAHAVDARIEMAPLLEWLNTTSARAVEQAPHQQVPASTFGCSVGAYVQRCPLRALALVALSGFFAGVVWGRT